VNWQHLRAFVWLRWRLLANGWRRAGSLNFVLTMIFAVGALVATVPVFIGSFLVGLYAMADAAPKQLLVTWDVLVCGFTFVWCIGVLTELQRTESLSLSKFMHLPVSLEGAFAINYLSSLFGLTMILFLPVLVGLALGLAFSHGPRLLLALPLSAAFLLMVTAVSYQFQGWVASLMSNPRRRRTVLVGATAVFILLVQAPNLINFLGVWGPRNRAGGVGALAQEQQNIEQQFQTHQIDQREYERRKQQVGQQIEQGANAQHARMAQVERVFFLLHWIVPIGWLPLGVKSAAEGGLLTGSLAFVAMTLVGAGSLWRAYRTTLGIYRGAFATGRVQLDKKAKTALAEKAVSTSGRRFIETHLPGLSEPVAAIALAGFRSLVRSPEAKMMLMTPFFMSVVAGGALVRQAAAMPVMVRPLLAIGAILMVLFGMAQLMANQFGFDRDGFRVFILCAAPRRDILLGKNLAYLPLAGGLAALLVAVVAAFCRLRIDHLLAMLPQFISMFLLFCLLANLLSILAPMAVAAGTLKPANQKFLPVLLQILFMMLFFPLAQLPTLLPLGAEALLEYLGWTHGVPVYLLLALAECAAVVLLYGLVLKWEGRLLQSREQKILASVVKAG
jgi:ABC-2 type transport system permease protein